MNSAVHTNTLVDLNGGDVRHIFLAEDDIDDQEFLIEALRQLDERLQIHVEASGDKAIDYLNELSDNYMPCLIILDYNLPKLNGQQILAHLKEKKRFRNVVKVVWSTSNSPQYREKCLQEGAMDYLVKPSDIYGIQRVAKQMLSFCTVAAKGV